MKRGKNYKVAADKLEAGKAYTLGDAVALIRQMPRAKFDETLEAAVRLGVDPKKADQMVRGTTVLPHGTGKTVKVLVLTKGEKAKEAQDAGADMVGAEDYVEKIQGGWADVDVIIATPDMMGQVGKLGKILGPKKLMPNPKSGTVTMDIAKAIKAVKAGKIEYRVDKTGNIQAGLGKVSFSDEALVENARTFFTAIMKAKPSTAKGTYLRSATLCSTMGPGIKLDVNEISALGK